MTIAIPTATSIKMRFPEFKDVPDAMVEFAIEEARLGVSDAWTVGADLALVYLSAHYVASGIAAAAAGGTGDTSGAIVSESFGRFSVTYAQSDASNKDATHDDTSTSSYGRRYDGLVDRNFGGPVVI